MRLARLTARNYRSLREESIEINALTLFIGANAAGKSTILDALRFLHEGLLGGSFTRPVSRRGGILDLAWKGAEANHMELSVDFEDNNRCFNWSVELNPVSYYFRVKEQVRETSSEPQTNKLLCAEAGVGWWQSHDTCVKLKQAPSICALAAASADASFPARDVAEFVRSWGFFDPNPFLLRGDFADSAGDQLHPHGWNLAETLYTLKESYPEVFKKIVTATRSIVGLPESIVPRKSEHGRFYFEQEEQGLKSPVKQGMVSSGTLRTLALMTAFYSPRTRLGLIGIEEPENYVHPSALSALVERMLDAPDRDRAQLMLTTHSPLLLDYVNDPSAVNIVKRGADGETTISRESAPELVRKALEASGFGLGEYYETKGFGG